MSDCKCKERFKVFRKTKLFKSLIITVAVIAAVAIVAGTICGINYESGGEGTPNTKLWFPYMNYSDDSTVYDAEEGYVLDYSYDYIIEMEKSADKDFVVLNLADTQKYGIEFMFGFADKTIETIDRLIKEVQPDLITMSGDNTWGSDVYYATKRLIKIMDSYKIPWAPVFGNHDGEVSNTSSNALADLYINESEYCIFAKGPANIGGVGNYVINVTEGGKIVHTFIMMDSHRNDYYLDKNGNPSSDYAYITPSQIEWYKWVVNGIAEKEGGVVESTAIFHIPLYEFKAANESYKEGTLLGTGSQNEGIFSAPINNGFFDVMKELGSTKQVLVGHDHVNDTIIDYEGITLAYALKTGDGCYWQDDGSMNGGTVITIGAETTLAHHYIVL